MKIEKQSIYYENLSIKNKLDYVKIHRSQKIQRIALLSSVLFLMLLSIANMISTTFYKVISSGKNILLSFGDPLKHIIWLVIGMVILVVTMAIPYTLYRQKKNRTFIFVASVLILLAVLIGSKLTPNLVPEINGAIGWIKLGSVTIQPSEFVKVSYVIILAHILDISRRKKLGDLGIILAAAVPISVFCLLVFKQGDLGTTIHYLVITGCMLLVSPLSKGIIFSAFSFATVSFGGLISWFYFQDVTGNYRIQRITSYVNILFKGNERDTGVGYQVIQSLIAMGNGGILGKGYGNGIQKYNYLPEIHTDFISSSLAEEWGFMMMIFVILVFLYILKVGINTAMVSKDYFAKYLVIGLSCLVFTQMLMNLYVATGLMPVTGLPLPIFSYGGSSTITIFISLGIVLNVNKKTMKDKYSKIVDNVKDE